MKGILLQETYGWVVRYRKSEEISPWYELNLHPKDVQEYSSELNNYKNKEISFHIVSHFEYDDSECCKNYGNCEHFIDSGIGECTKGSITKNKYAKLVFMGKSDNWEDIIDDITDLFGITIDVRVREYLEETYNIPTPKFIRNVE